MVGSKENNCKQTSETSSTQYDSETFYTGTCMYTPENGPLMSCSSGFKEIPIYATYYYGSKDCGKTGNYYSYTSDEPVGQHDIPDYITYEKCPDNE